MANRIYEYWRQAATFPIGATFKDKLPDSGMLSGLLIEVNGTAVSGATLATAQYRLIDFLTSLQVIGNGSTIIHSTQFKDWRYFNFLDTKKLPMTWWRNYASQAQREVILVTFGRWLWDTDYGLDLSKWSRVEVALTNNGSGTYFTGDLSTTILGCYMQDAPGGFARGYLRKEEFKSWTTVQNAWEYSLLPTTNPLRGVHVQLLPAYDGTTFAEDTGMVNLADNVLFWKKTPQTYMHQGPISQRLYLDHFEHEGLGITSEFVDRTADKYFSVGLGYVYGMAGVSGSKDGAVSTAVPTIDGDNNGGRQNLENREADSPVHLLSLGLAPQNMISMHYVQDCDQMWMLDPARDGAINLDIHTRDSATADNGTNRILLDSVYPHPTVRA